MQTSESFLLIYVIGTEAWVGSTDDIIYHVSQSMDTMVASTALAILSLATDGNMPFQWIWKRAMNQGRAGNAHWHFSFPEIVYYGHFCDGTPAGDARVSTYCPVD
jgi:hypothetical protein